jgi:hypothetical protein
MAGAKKEGKMIEEAIDKNGKEPDDELFLAIEATVQKYLDDELIRRPPDSIPEDPNYDHWGYCPECHRNDGLLNYGRDHYMICRTHRLAWHVGSNLFSAWREDSELDRVRQKILLRFGYHKIENSWHPPRKYTMADGTEKLITDLKRGDIFVEDGCRYEVDEEYTDGSLEYHVVRPDPCPTCGHRELMPDEIPF